ncbi:uncharacterized protein EI90DRAFT_3018172 [Cantharellus anzutake]|uniref:uncharacterized protein n=1 Tax=Cantharellus anzutake TaxID=1750568 RepID=UPI0019079E1B|nr:uncharacterized protein EI90DRAFT_3018172 [Cantharellus anzutake]KAF8327433.1 hypothetical protein EI90DRAFT_3018172 [Cantharellus anzutake]
MSLKQKLHGIIAAGGDVAVPVLTAVNAASGVLPPLQATAAAALSILNEVKKFKENKEDWELFGRYVTDATARVVVALDSYDASSEGAWVGNIRKLDQALQRIQTEISRLREKMERRSGIRNFFSHMKKPGRIGDLKRNLDEALALFQLGTNLTIGNNQDRLNRVIENSSVLDKLQYPAVAHHDLTQACLDGTRTGLIEDIMSWCRNTGNSEKRVLLVTAVAGAGKTSLAHSIAEECSKGGMLLLSFFFKAGEQSRPDHLFSGMARSLATHDPTYRSYLISTIQKDPTLATASFLMQFEKLVAELLRLKAPPSDSPGMVIIDALDECDEQAFKYLAKILWEQVPKLPSNIKFFVTSRQFGLLGPHLSNYSVVHRLSINLSDDANVRDCNIYIRKQLRELKDVHPHLKDELDEEDKLVQDILRRAGGLFIWISTVFRYMQNTSRPPMRMLEELLDTGANRSKVPAEGEMDRLYTRVLEKCDWRNDDFVHDYPIVMGAILIAQQPLSIVAWDAVLSPHLKSPVRYTLAELSPLVSGVGDSRIPIRVLHQSFRDFLTERVGLQSPTLRRFAVDVRRENAKVALCCIEILKNDLSSVKGLGLIEGDLSKEAELPPIPKGILSEQMYYACRYIAHHLNQVQEPLEVLNESVRAFLGQQIVRWVEVCVRTGGYISISSFPEWAKVWIINCIHNRFLSSRMFLQLGIDQTSKEVIQMLVKVFGDVRRNLAFFLRLQEAYELANDSVELCRCLVSADPDSYTTYLARSLGHLGASLANLGWHSESLSANEESVELFRKVVAVHQTSYTPDLARSLVSLKTSLTNLGRHSEALPVIEESITLWRELVAAHPTSYTPDLARGLNSLEVSLNYLGRHSAALPVIGESVKLWRELVAVHPTSYIPDLARALHDLNWSLLELGQYSEALPVIEESVKLWRELVAVHPTSYIPDLARALHDLNWSLLELGRYSEALPVIEESIKFWRGLIAVHSTSFNSDLARALRNLEASLTNLGRHSEALLAIQESIKLWRDLVAVHPTPYTPDLARALLNLRISFSNLGRHSDALPVIEESITLWRELVAVHPASYTPDLALALQSLEASLNYLGRHSEALPVIEESVKLWHELVAVHPTSYTPHLARALHHLNWTLLELGQYKALPMIEESVKLWRELVAIHPTSYSSDLARALRNLNSSLDTLGRYSESLPVIEESVQLWRELVAVHPTSYTPDLARALHDLNWSLLKLGRYSEALQAIEESIKLWRELIAVHPTSYTSDLARALRNLETSLTNLGRHPDALSSDEEGIKLRREPIAVHPTSYPPDLT